MTYKLMVVSLLSGLAQVAVAQTTAVGEDEATTQHGWVSEQGFDLIGPGKCRDVEGGTGEGDDESVFEIGQSFHPLKDSICLRRCAAVEWCKAYSDVGIDCEYYKVEIVSSDGVQVDGAGHCYKKQQKASSSESTSDAKQAALGAFTLLGAAISFFM